MTNLLEKMKPEPLAKLNKVKVEHQNIFKAIESELIKNTSILDLRYETVTLLYLYDIAKDLKFFTIENLFND